jgi:cysteine-rich repeat protein
MFNPMKFSLVLLLLAGACTGDDEVVTALPDAGGGPDGSDDGCLVLSVSDRQFQFNLFNQLTGVSYAVSPGIGGDTPERLLIELYDSSTPDLPPLTEGTFPLDQAPDDALSTCQHCVWMPIDWNGFDPVVGLMVATDGDMILTQVSDPLEIVFSGELHDVVLREATLDESGNAVLVDGGACARLATLEFDTSPTPGAACLSVTDCGNYFLEVCDPREHVCTPPQCGEGFFCGPTEICLSQMDFLIDGACYGTCDPTADAAAAALGCQAGEDCVQAGVDPTFGICKTAGTADVGQACEVEDTTTSCVPGALCAGGACTRQCQFFAAEPGCQAGAQCTVLGTCTPPTPSAAVAIGQPCTDAFELAEGCAADDDVFRGICFAYDGPLVCERACFEDQGCNFTDEFCALRFSSGLGVCKPIPVCGDGEVGEINETCDDGNEMSGDGCSGDCQTVEYDIICGGLGALSTDATLTGDTGEGWDGFQASCQLGLARAELYDFVPPGFGRLRAWVESPTEHLVSLRTACDEPGTELACANSSNFFGFEIVHQVTTLEPLVLMASAMTILDEGPFTLHVEWVDESCGDGVIAGREVCDDNNQMAGDGCSADCSAVEYDVLCAAATQVVAGMPATGDNTGGTNVFASGCSNDVFGSGRERLHTFTAPTAGTLRVTLDEGDVNLTLGVYDGCGAPGTIMELGCSSVRDIEEVEVQVTAGQTVMILVEGFGEPDLGPYTLTAQLLP